MTLDIPALLNGSVNRAINTTRYSRQSVHRVETVAEHTFTTLVCCSVVGHYLESRGYEVDHGILLNKALWHDVEEPGGTGDIIRSVKHSTPQLRAALEELGKVYVERLSSELLMPEILDYWLNAKDATLEGQIVRVSDLLSVVSYVVLEFRMGNRTLNETYKEILNYFRTIITEVDNPELCKILTETRCYLCDEFSGLDVEWDLDRNG